MSAQPSITAAVCTYNRCGSLKDTLRSLAAQALPSGQTIEILVVDNNSTDDTRQVVQEEAARSAQWPIRSVLEPHQGIAFARNRALLGARGEYVAYVDDDAVADAGWAAAILRCAQETGADMVGGRILPLWLADRPRWLADDLMGPITAFNLGLARVRCSAPAQAFLTTNCALRRSRADRLGLFDVTLGRRGTRWVGGEDFELFIRWLRQGAAIYYEPTAVVHHKVEPERVTPQFYRRWYEDVGYTQAHQLEPKWHYRLSIVPAWRWKKLLAAGARYATTRLGRAGEDARLQTELWWKFERSFLKERVDHWIGKPDCHFAKA
ncbi:MAG: hypothetical protein COV75_04040 [Candidatus Omnitrophica bacterium CG11_big_fil_rev_8_21_14_0_20_63_9]|nr:MAG: hypothetical protein COV75_04040 [Candidatus Omnitrophica bacterium CG11_big_fil_rev_8_21_14_0_20_63_9]